VFPANWAVSLPPGAPGDRIEAPYEDVFRAATMATTQAALVVEVADKRRAVILASRDSQEPWQGRSQPTTYYYAIAVVEKGADLTEVHVESKVQASCEKPGPGAYLRRSPVSGSGLGDPDLHPEQPADSGSALSRGWRARRPGAGRHVLT